MTWTPPAKPVNWQDTPSTSTALDAANLNADEAYGATVGSSVISWLEAGSSTAVASATSPLGDPYGRTQVSSTGTVQAPALRRFVFVEDAPWGAKGDVKRVADGAITTGTNALSSTSAAFTSADVGKVVEVLGASSTSTAPNLLGYIGSVSSGVASIFTTSGFGTPANATATVSGATVTYGTDDSAAVQAATKAVSQAGGGDLNFDSTKAYWFSKVVPWSNVTLDGNGATFYVLPLPADGVNPNPALWLAPQFTGQAPIQTTASGAQTLPVGTINVASTATFPTSGTLSVNTATAPAVVTYTGTTSTTFTGCVKISGGTAVSNAAAISLLGVSNFTARNMDWVGHGKEVHLQFPTQMQGGSNWRFYDNTFSNFCIDALYLGDVAECHVAHNTFANCCAAFPPGTATTGNPLNLAPGVYGSALPLTDLFVTENHVYGQISEGIDITTASSGSTASQTVPIRATVAHNVVESAGGTAAGWGIVLEIGGTGAVTVPIEAIDISNNVLTGGTILAEGSTTASSNPALLQKIVIADNTVVDVTSANFCIDARGSYIAVTGNTVKGPSGIRLVNSTNAAGAADVALTGDFTNASATVLNVSGGGSITNGTQLRGNAGIGSGVYLLSGAGTTTWTLSSAFTGTTATTAAFSATPMAQGNLVANNTIHHVAAGFLGIGVSLSFVRDSKVIGNVVTSDATGGYFGGSYQMTTGNCGWVELEHNRFEYAPFDGARLSFCNDLTIHGNVIYNPSQNGAGAAGLWLRTVTGTMNLIDTNRITDDRAVHLMAAAINQFDANSTNLYLRNNALAGSTSSALSSITGVVEARGNVGYNPVGSVTVTVPATTVAVAAQPYDRTFYITAGASTCTLAIQNGPSPVIPASAFGTIRVPAGKTLTPTFTNAPTWAVEGE